MYSVHCNVRQRTKQGAEPSEPGQRGDPPPPDFDRPVNPIPKGGADYANPITPATLDLQTFLRP